MKWCIADTDGGDFLDAGADCPNDPPNTDPACMDDLPNCGYLYNWKLVMTEGAITAAGGVAALPVGSCLVIGGTTLSDAALRAVTSGMALLTASRYCATAGLEG